MTTTDVEDPPCPWPKRPAVLQTCPQCQTRFWAPCSKVDHGRGKYCSRECLARFTVPIRKKVDWTGQNNPAWQGGISKEPYRYKLRQVERYPERIAARRAVASAVRKGELERGPCADCGSTEKTHAHHEDYTRPLDVIWLCRPCHRVRHGGNH